MIRLGVKICLNYLLFIIIKLLSDAALQQSVGSSTCCFLGARGGGGRRLQLKGAHSTPSGPDRSDYQQRDAFGIEVIQKNKTQKSADRYLPFDVREQQAGHPLEVAVGWVPLYFWSCARVC